MWGDSDPEWTAGDDAAGFTPRATLPTYRSTSAATGEFFLTSRLHGRVRYNLSSTSSTDLANLMKACHRKGMRFFANMAVDSAIRYSYQNINFQEFHVAAGTGGASAYMETGDERASFGGVLFDYRHWTMAYDQSRAKSVTWFRPDSSSE